MFSLKYVNALYLQIFDTQNNILFKVVASGYS